MSESARTLVGTTVELLRNILFYLTVEKSRPDGKTIGIDRNALRQCVVVSHTFSELAIDILWENLDHLSHLTNMLPSFCCIQQDPGSGEFLVVRTGGPIRDSEWSRFAYYAGRVRTLKYDHGVSWTGDTASVHPDVMTAIAQHASPQAALPGLVNLHWAMVTHVPQGQLVDLLPTSLRSLAMILFHPFCYTASYVGGSWAAVLAVISRCPELASLTFNSPANKHCIPLAITGPPPTNLKELSLELYEDHAVHVVWNLPAEWFASLETLTLSQYTMNLDGLCQCPMSSVPASSGDFLRRVKNITLLTSILKAAAFLGATRSQTLQRLELQFSGVRTTVDLPSFESPLTTAIHRFSATLQSLTLHLTWERGNPMGQNAMEPLTPWLAPLLSLHGLVSFELRAYGVCTYVSAQDVSSMARAWPRITWIRVLDENRAIAKQNITNPEWPLTPVPVTTLLAFAEHCPNLQHLVLCPLYLTAEGCSLESWLSSADSVSAPQLLTLAANLLPCAGEDRPRVDRAGVTETPSSMRPFLDAVFPNAKRTFWGWRAQFVRRLPVEEVVH